MNPLYEKSKDLILIRRTSDNTEFEEYPLIVQPLSALVTNPQNDVFCHSLCSLWVGFARSASYSETGSYSRTSSHAFWAITASNARTASHAFWAITSSYAISASNAETASYALTASHAFWAITSSNAISASYAISSSHNISSSYALTASYGDNFHAPRVTSSFVSASEVMYTNHLTASTILAHLMTGTASSAIFSFAAISASMLCSQSVSNAVIFANASGSSTTSTNLAYDGKTLLITSPTGNSASLKLYYGLQFQDYGYNNSWIADSVHFDGFKFVYDDAVYGSMIYFLNGETQFINGHQAISPGQLFAASASVKISDDGWVALGNEMNSAAGSTQGATMVVSSSGVSIYRGGLTASLSGTLRGTLNGTASWAITSSYAISASNAETASYALTASHALWAITASNARTASHALWAVTSSYAISASNAETASYAISSSRNISSSYAESASYGTNFYAPRVTSSFVSASNVVYTNQLTASTILADMISVYSSGITSSLNGTASWATSASWARSASYVSSSESIIGRLSSMYITSYGGMSVGGYNENVIDTSVVQIGYGIKTANKIDNTVQIGYSAGSFFPGTASNAVQIGWNAGNNTKQGSYAVQVGSQAGFSSETASFAVQIGGSAGNSSATASSAVQIGYWAGYSSADAREAVQVGAAAGQSATNASQSVLVGAYAGYNAGHSSVMLGYKAGYNDATPQRLHIANTDAKTLIYGEFDNDLVIINSTLSASVVTANKGAKIGGMSEGIASTNTVQIGTTDVGVPLPDASYKRNGAVQIGWGAGQSAITASNAVAIGIQAGTNTKLADNAVQIGSTVGANSITASNAVQIGVSAGQNATNASNAVHIGSSAGTNATSGSYTTFVGSGADTLNADLNVEKSIAIGYNAKVSGSNMAVIGGTGADAVSVGIGTNSPQATLHVVGNISASSVTASLFGTASYALSTALLGTATNTRFSQSYTIGVIQSTTQSLGTIVDEGMYKITMASTIGFYGGIVITQPPSWSFVHTDRLGTYRMPSTQPTYYSITPTGYDQGYAFSGEYIFQALSGSVIEYYYDSNGVDVSSAEGSGSFFTSVTLTQIMSGSVSGSA